MKGNGGREGRKGGRRGGRAKRVSEGNNIWRQREGERERERGERRWRGE